MPVLRLQLARTARRPAGPRVRGRAGRRPRPGPAAGLGPHGAQRVLRRRHAQPVPAGGDRRDPLGGVGAAALRARRGDHAREPRVRPARANRDLRRGRDLGLRQWRGGAPDHRNRAQTGRRAPGAAARDAVPWSLRDRLVRRQSAGTGFEWPHGASRRADHVWLRLSHPSDPALLTLPRGHRFRRGLGKPDRLHAQPAPADRHGRRRPFFLLFRRPGSKLPDAAGQSVQLRADAAGRRRGGCKGPNGEFCATR